MIDPKKQAHNQRAQEWLEKEGLEGPMRGDAFRNTADSKQRWANWDRAKRATEERSKPTIEFWKCDDHVAIFERTNDSSPYATDGVIGFYTTHKGTGIMWGMMQAGPESINFSSEDSENKEFIHHDGPFGGWFDMEGYVRKLYDAVEK